LDRQNKSKLQVLSWLHQSQYGYHYIFFASLLHRNAAHRKAGKYNKMLHIFQLQDVVLTNELNELTDARFLYLLEGVQGIKYFHELVRSLNEPLLMVLEKDC